MKKKNKNNKEEKGFSKIIMNGLYFQLHTTNIDSFDDVYKKLKKKNEKDGIKTEIKHYNEYISVVSFDDIPSLFVNQNEGSTVLLPTITEPTYMSIYDYSNVREARAGNLLFFSTKSGEVDNFLETFPIMLKWKEIYAFNTFKDFIHNLEEPTYEVAPNKWVVANNEGKPLYYFNGNNCIIIKTQNPHVYAILPGIGNRYFGMDTLFHCDLFTNKGRTQEDIMRSYFSQTWLVYNYFSELSMLHDEN